MATEDKKELEAEAPKTVFLKCRKGSDPATHGSSCSSMKAYNLSNPGSPVAMFRCAECGFTWSTMVGGQANLGM